MKKTVNALKIILRRTKVQQNEYTILSKKRDIINVKAIYVHRYYERVVLRNLVRLEQSNAIRIF